MPSRGDGIGLEVASTSIRAIRLDRSEPGRIGAVADVAVSSFEDDGAIHDALIRITAKLATTGDIRGLPLRMAWFPAGATLQRLDVTGRSGPELNSLRHELSESVGITSTMLVDADARRWMLGLRWDHSRAWRLQELAERAGLADVIIEPSPVALQRALDPEVTLARRDTSPDHSWVALYEGGVPIAAAGVEPGHRISPGLGTSNGSAALLRADFEEPMHASDLSVAVAGLAAEELDLHAQADELELLLQAGDQPYPPFPAHDPKAPQRIAVALGAAVGAAGLAGRLRPVDVLTPTSAIPEEMPRPWAIERLPNTPLAPPPPAAQPQRRRPWSSRT